MEVGVIEEGVGGLIWPKISGGRGRPPSTFLVLKNRFIDLSCIITIWAEVCFVLSQFMRLKDGRTDGSLVTRPHMHSCSAVKSW